MTDCPRLLLWAQQGRLRKDADAIEPSAFNDLLWAVVCVAGIVIVVWQLWRYVARQQQARCAYSPYGLFRQLCRAHDLDRSARKALWQLAEQQDLAHPARLFLEPEHFSAVLDAPGYQGRLYRDLHQKLFGELGAASAVECDHASSQ